MHGEEAMDENCPPRPVENEQGVVELRSNETKHLKNLSQETIPDPTCPLQLVDRFEKTPETGW